ncbi:MAG: Eisosome component PIL1-domain-containing protein [Benniella sp.]|nr:MAG: Eisosome component PIL1-domain-containing protein [Benniella sp.]
MQSIGHDLRRGFNNINPLGNNYKTINKWLAEMKNIDSSLKTLDKEISADAKLIAAWGTSEGDDLADVCQRMAQLMEELGLIQQAFSLRHTAYRKTIKSLKMHEMNLDENRKKKHDLTTQIAKAQKASKENPIKLMELHASLERVTAELDAQELELKQYKRVTIKEAFDAKFDAMLEYGEKMALIAGYGRAITLVIDTEKQAADTVRIYNGGEYTAGAVNQVKAAVTSWQPQPMNVPAQSHVPVAAITPAVATMSVASIAPSQDELALSAAVAACNSKTPPLSHNSYTANDGYSNDGEEHGDKSTYTSPAPTHAEQVSRIQEQQRRLELEQQRLYQQNLASYSPEPTPSQQHYQDAAGNGHNTTPPPRNNTQELYPPTPPIYESPGQGYNRNSQAQYGQYDTSTYQAPARNYRLGFVDPRERSQMENSRYRSDLLPPLQFSNSPIMHEK